MMCSFVGVQYRGLRETVYVWKKVWRDRYGRARLARYERHAPPTVIMLPILLSALVFNPQPALLRPAPRVTRPRDVALVLRGGAGLASLGAAYSSSGSLRSGMEATQ